MNGELIERLKREKAEYETKCRKAGAREFDQDLAAGRVSYVEFKKLAAIDLDDDGGAAWDAILSATNTDADEWNLEAVDDLSDFAEGYIMQAKEAWSVISREL
jgi:hypothetical protein